MRLTIALLAILTSLLQAQPSCIKYSPIINQTRFILVVDVSGSMSGQALDDAKLGLRSFVNHMDPSDAAALITFSTSVNVIQSMTGDKGDLKKHISRMNSGGSTRLYDAVAKAVEISRNYEEKTAIVVLTDGQDSGSQFTAQHIESMVAYHGIAFYGIGLGEVNEKALRNLAKKTSGEFKLTPNSSELKKLYESTSDVYRKRHISHATDTAELIVKSMPGGRDVIFDGKNFGQTPLKLINIQPGEHTLEVQFEAGPWTCTSYFNPNMIGSVRAIESEVDKNIAVISIPHGSAVFLDGDFQGYTSHYGEKSTSTTSGIFFKKTSKTIDYSQELILENIPRGKHTLSIVPFAGSDGAGMFDKLEYPFVMGTKSLIIKADARTGKAELETTRDKLKPKVNRFKFDHSTIPDDF